MFSVRKSSSSSCGLKETSSEFQKDMFHSRNFSVDMAIIVTFIQMCAKKEENREFSDGFSVDMSSISSNDFDSELKCPNWSPKFSISFSDSLTFRVDEDTELTLFTITPDSVSQMVQKFLGDIPRLTNAEFLQLNYLGDNLFSALNDQTYSEKDVLKVLHVFDRKAKLVDCLDYDLSLVNAVPYSRTWVHDLPKSLRDGTVNTWWKRCPFFHQEDWNASQLESFQKECSQILALYPPN
jgi:hypothetical protein